MTRVKTATTKKIITTTIITMIRLLHHLTRPLQRLANRLPPRLTSPPVGIHRAVLSHRSSSIQSHVTSITPFREAACGLDASFAV